MAVKYGKKVRELMVKEMQDVFTGKKGFVFSSLQNIKATEMDSFRRDMKQAGSRYFVIKNRLGKIALEEAGLSEFTATVDEQNILGVGVIEDDPVKVAKVMMGFAKKNKGFEVSKGYLEGRVLSAEKIKELSELPGREQLLAMVLSMMNAPITGFVGVLSALLKNVVYALNAIKEKKEKGDQ